MASAYTAIDKEKEDQCLRTLVKIADSIRAHEDTIKEEAKRQDGICGKLWSLSQRIAVLRRGIPGYKIHPTQLAYTVECELIDDFNSNYTKLNESTKIICKSFEELQSSLKQFNAEVQSLDKKVYSELIRGSKKQQPLQFYLDLIDDAVDYFQKFSATMQNLKYLLKPDKSWTIENYQNFLKTEASEIDTSLNFYKLSHVKRNVGSVSGRT